MSLWGRRGAPRGASRGLNVTAANLPAFLNCTDSLGVLDVVQPGVANLTDLNLLLACVLRDHVEHECLADGKLVVQGQSVFLAAAVSLPCPGQEVRAVEVYATGTVFVDGDVRLPGGSLVVVAPRWEVLGERLVSLDGLPGRRMPPPSAAECGGRGSDGLPGQPGAAGGSFLGVGAVFSGTDKLVISVSGGDGGPGQEGGAGGRGASGGGNGGDGGDGGEGGMGGSPGRAELLSVVSDTEPDVQVDMLYGIRGVAGRGGRGGEHGAVMRKKRDGGASLLLGLLLGGALVSVLAKSSQGSSQGQFRDGHPGRDGVVAAGLLPAVAPQLVHWDDVPARVENYLRHHLDHPYRRRQLQRFLEQVNQSERLHKLT